MAKIYISSTYSDLIDERNAAVEAVLRLRQHAIAMEHYVATDQRPLEKCVSDVQSSDIYVGIIGWRYGFIPDGHDKSITHLELEAATAAKIPRLIFLCHPDTRVDTGEPPASVEKLMALRDQVANEMIINFFNTPGELEALITAAVSNALVDLKPAAGHQGTANARALVPQLLPYLADRSEQEYELRNAWRHFCDNRANRPFLIISHGGEDEAHDWFLERLCEVSLPRLIHGQNDGIGFEKHLVKWPPRNLKIDESPNYFLETIGERLTGSTNIDAQQFKDQLVNRSPLLLHSLLLSEDWQFRGSELLQSYLRFWSDVPDVSVDKSRPVFVLICLQYQHCESGGFFERRRVAKTNRQIREFISGLSQNEFPGIHLRVLSELSAVQQQDAEEWVHLEAVGEWCHAPDLLREIRNLYRDQKKSAAGGHIPMEELGLALEELIREHRRA